MKVLLVDDAPDIRMLATAVLQASEYFEVTAISSGAGALEYLREETVDVLLVDLMMPDMDGIEFLARCRDLEGLAEVPAVLLTADPDSDRISALDDAGLVGVIAKPFDPRMLGEKLVTILRPGVVAPIKPATR